MIGLMVAKVAGQYDLYILSWVRLGEDASLWIGSLRFVML
jgi:hypothetical protein